MPETLIQEISVLSLRPEDVVVAKTAMNLPSARMAVLKEELVTLLRRFGYDNKVLVLNGVTLEVLRKEEE